jgi:hypothetical protein
MKNINKKIFTGTVLLMGAGIYLTSCYKTFDPDSYKPVFTISGFSAVNQIQPSALVAYWAFDGSLIDSVSSAVATNKGTAFANGFKGSALNLSVQNKAHATATPGASITGTKSFTVSYWVNPTFVDTDNNNAIDGIIGMFTLANTSEFWGNIDFFVENNSNNTSAVLKVHVRNGANESWLDATYPGLFGVWSNHTLSYDAATSKLTYYINGSKVKDATAAWTGDLAFTNSGPIVFGTAQFQANPSLGSAGGPQSWASYLTGSLDEVRLYNKALTPTEINALVVLQGKGK